MKYIKPEFDVTIYEVEDILTESPVSPETTTGTFTDEDPDGNDFEFWG